jgi:hypothetical protein
VNRSIQARRRHDNRLLYFHQTLHLANGNRRFPTSAFYLLWFQQLYEESKMTEISISAPTSSANQPLALSSERGSRPNSCGVLQPGTHQAEGMLWHYAPWFYLQHMVDSGDLRPSNAGAPDLTPTLWFSANQNWEPTATKLLPDASSLSDFLTLNFVLNSRQKA